MCQDRKVNQGVQNQGNFCERRLSHCFISLVLPNSQWMRARGAGNWQTGWQLDFYNLVIKMSDKFRTFISVSTLLSCGTGIIQTLITFSKQKKKKAETSWLQVGQKVLIPKSQVCIQSVLIILHLIVFMPIYVNLKKMKLWWHNCWKALRLTKRENFRIWPRNWSFEI